jgi:predicted RNase H-like nuclease (RuvC/YqgF family)
MGQIGRRRSDETKRKISENRKLAWALKKMNETLMDKLDRWVHHRINNYGRNDTLSALQQRIIVWKSELDIETTYPDCLEDKLDRLMEYLGLEEVEKPAQVKIRKRATK